jgi:hypothetical protein
MARAQCFAFDSETRLRCGRPGGHAGLHRVAKEFEDDTAWVPLLDGADLAEQIKAGVVTPIRSDLYTEPTEAEYHIADDPVLPDKTCVVCQHQDPHLTPEEAGDDSGCTAAGCGCMTAVWV